MARRELAFQRLDRKARVAVTALTLVLLAAAATLVSRCVQQITPEPIIAESASAGKELVDTARRIIRLLEQRRFWNPNSQLGTYSATKDRRADR